MDCSKAGGVDSRAAILGLGTAVPDHVWPQESFPDYYFEISNSNHLVDLKAKFRRICERTMVEKRHVYMSDEFLRSNPSVTGYRSPSLSLRQQLTDATVPQLGAEAARKAIGDWGRRRRASDITHLVFCTTSSGCMPGADFEVVKLLGLPLSTKRFMLYQVGCHGGGLALRLAKDLAENNRGARVLVVCSEVIAMALRGPSETHLGNLVGQAIFGDAACAAIVGVASGGRNDDGETPLFEMVSASQVILPGTECGLVAKLHEEGIVYTLHPDMALHISGSIEELVEGTLALAGLVVGDRSEELFWVVHPGGRKIVDAVESALGLGKEKLAASREVMRRHGNTMSSCVLIALEEMRRRSADRGLRTPGEGLEWGLLFGFGPGITVETILLRALPNDDDPTTA